VISSDGAVLTLVLHDDAVDEHAMEGAVVGQERGRFRAGDFAKGFFQGVGWDSGIEAAQGFAEAAGEENLLEGLALGRWLFWGDVGAEDGGVAEGGKPGECGFFDEGFCEGHDFVPLIIRFGRNSSQISWIGFSPNAFFIGSMAFCE